MAPGAAVGFAGPVVGPGIAVGAGVGVLGSGLSRGVGKDGSVGPVPGRATGLPSMTVLQPATSMTPASRAPRA